MVAKGPNLQINEVTANIKSTANTRKLKCCKGEKMELQLTESSKWQTCCRYKTHANDKLSEHTKGTKRKRCKKSCMLKKASTI